MSQIITAPLSDNFIQCQCFACGQFFFVSENRYSWYIRKIGEAETLYCPNGHGMVRKEARDYEFKTSQKPQLAIVAGDLRGLLSKIEKAVEQLGDAKDFNANLDKYGMEPLEITRIPEPEKIVRQPRESRPRNRGKNAKPHQCPKCKKRYSHYDAFQAHVEKCKATRPQGEK
jgi:hypothetical protein